MKDQQEIRG